MFPIHNESGKVIAFGGRAMRDEDQPKYLNSPETPIYRKSSVLYNLHRARDGMRKLESRGAGGRLHGRDRGVCGGRQGSGGELRHGADATRRCGRIHRHADTVVVNFDPDTAGANAAEKAIQLLARRRLARACAGAGRRARSGRIREAERRRSLSGQAGCGQRIFSLAGGPRPGQVSICVPPMAAWTRSNFCCRRCRRFTDKLERAAVANDVAGYLGVDPGLVLDQFKKAPQRSAGPAPRRPLQPRLVDSGLERILLNALIAQRRGPRGGAAAALAG